MGNVIPLNSDKKEKIEDLAKDFLGTFSVEFIQAYGIEYARTKLAEIDKESFKEEKAKRELMYREDEVEDDEPIKKGYLIKQGAVVKNWKKRYFVVKQDNSIEYYENQEAFEKGFKQKGVIYPAGYKVEEDADGVIIERLKKVAKQLGVDEKDIPFPEKYPPFTFELGHESRRSYYITAENEEEKKEWIEVMKTCCARFKGFRNPDPISRVAFKHAYHRTCYYHLFVHYSENTGTEEQVLTSSIVREIDSRVMGEVYSNLSTLPGGYKVRRKVREQVIKTLESLVTAMVIPSYKGQVEASQKMIGPLDDLIKNNKDTIVETQKKLTQKLSDELDDKFAVAFEGIQEAVIGYESELKEVAKKMVSPAREHILLEPINKIVELAKDNDDIEVSLKEYFKRLCNSQGSWWKQDKWYHFYNSATLMLPISRKQKETFGGYSPYYGPVYTALNMMAEVLVAASYTFEELFKDISKGTDALKNGKTAAEVMVTCKDQMLPKFDADALVVANEISFHLAHEAVVYFLTTTMEPVTKDLLSGLKSTIPDPINKVVSVQDRYEMYINQIAKRMLNKALGIEVSTETPKEAPEKPAEDKESELGAEKPGEAENQVSEEKPKKTEAPANDENNIENAATNDQPTTDL